MNGVINFLKPPGMSSNGAVVFLRGLLGKKKTGHAGTLDPGACGVLPICVGKATKISSYLMGGEKEYIAEIAFGKSTDTGDSYGTVTGVSDKTFPGEQELKKVLTDFYGTISQQTPGYSAAKHNGRKLYQIARAGKDVPVKTRDVVIREIEHIGQTKENAHLIRVVCGKGTYIRTLCEDIAKRLDTLAHMSFLVRTKCGGLEISQALTADELIDMNENREQALLSMDMFLKDISMAAVDSGNRNILLNGGSIGYEEADEHSVRVYADKEFLGIGLIKDHRLKITTLLVDR